MNKNLLLTLVLAIIFKSGVASAAACLEVRPPSSVGSLTLNQPVPASFIKKNKPKVDAKDSTWFETSSIRYQIKDKRVTAIEFTPARYRGCVRVAGAKLKNGLIFEKIEDRYGSCPADATKYGISSIRCAGFDVVQESVLSKSPMFRLDEDIKEAAVGKKTSKTFKCPIMKMKKMFQSLEVYDGDIKEGVLLAPMNAKEPLPHVWAFKTESPQVACKYGSESEILITLKVGGVKSCQTRETTEGTGKFNLLECEL